MKNSVIAIIAVVAVIFITAASFRPSGRVPAPQSIPDSIFAVFSKSCVGCHSTDGNKMALSKLNFDNWDSYTSEKKSMKASAINKMLTKGAMPPSSFKKKYPDLVPKEADVKKVLKWTSTYSK